MLGHYENFPETIHGVARFAHRLSARKFQQVILQTFHRLNQEPYPLNVITPFFSLKCDVSFEFGVADGIEFNYLDKEEMDKFQKRIVKRALPLLDFLCVVRYHVVKEGKLVPLKFDYHLLRLTFHRNNVQLEIFHERGIQRVSLEDLITFIAKQIKNELFQRRLKPLTLKYLRTL